MSEHLDPQLRLQALVAAEATGCLPPLLLFYGPRPARDESVGPWVLSQWWPAAFVVDGVEYRHAEGFMMAAKARLFGDVETLRSILLTDEPAEAKRLGRQVRPFDERRWAAARYRLVVEGNMAKFGQSPELEAYLASTAPAVLVEASPRDLIWGIGLDMTDPRSSSPSRWRGRNLLGFALTEVRARLTAS